MLEFYEVESIQELSDSIIDMFKDEVQSFVQAEYYALKKSHKREINDNVDTEWFFLGFLFSYKNGDVINSFLPKEIKKELSKIDALDLPEFDDELDYSSIFDGIDLPF